MDKFDRICELHKILRERRTPISREDIMAHLDCSEPTFYRLMGLLKDQLFAPTELDRESGGYFYRRDERELVMDILKHGPGVEVAAPESLRRKFSEALAKALALYRGP